MEIEPHGGLDPVILNCPFCGRQSKWIFPHQIQSEGLEARIQALESALKDMETDIEVLFENMRESRAHFLKVFAAALRKL